VGRLEVAAVDGCSAVVTCLASSPLQLLAPRARGRAVWTLAASHGGGLVPGDAIELEVALGPGATACLGTQAETKVYREADAGGASHRVTAAVGEGGLLALLPDPVSPFGGSRYQQLQRFELAAGASLVVLDAVTAGRAARGERWAFAGWRSRNEVRVAGQLVLADGMRLEAGHGPPVARRLLGVELLATVILVGPRVAPAAREILEAVSGVAAAGDAPVLEAASPLADGVLLRVAARSVEDGMAALRSRLAFLAAPLDGDPLLRRP
jgi:urease accessory protein